MGVNNRQRRAAKRRQRRHQRRGPMRGAGAYGHRAAGRQRPNAASVVVLVQAAVAVVAADRGQADAQARLLAAAHSGVDPREVAAVTGSLLRYAVADVVRGGWSPSDLAQLVRRRIGPAHLPLLAALLAGEAASHPPALVATAWLDDLALLGEPDYVDLASTAGLALGLGLAATLVGLPVIVPALPVPGTQHDGAGTVNSNDAKLLARVRALLAKAESTGFPEEAETLTAKAQELVSRHALDRISSDRGDDTGQAGVVARRLWIDPPYVLGKAALIDAVAGANRCRAVVAESLGFSTLVGEPRDLEFVELLVTSLLVQTDAAMLCWGRHQERGGPRTKSFRRSFLFAFATRIGERLQAADQQVLADTGRSGQLVPVLRRHTERVDRAVEELFPDLVSRATSISNAHGWAAGRAAADLARLGVDRVLAETPG